MAYVVLATNQLFSSQPLPYMPLLLYYFMVGTTQPMPYMVLLGYKTLTHGT